MHIEIGGNYYVETVTKYWVGRVASIDGPNSVTLVDCAWVASTGRFNVFLKSEDTESVPNVEIEPVPDGIEVQVSYVSIQPWPHKLLRKAVPS